jgi:hypothetical protein
LHATLSEQLNHHYTNQQEYKKNKTFRKYLILLHSAVLGMTVGKERTQILFHPFAK